MNKTKSKSGIFSALAMLVALAMPVLLLLAVQSAWAAPPTPHSPGRGPVVIHRPDPTGQVRLILQLEGEPLALYAVRLRTPEGRMAPAASTALAAHAEALRSAHRQVNVALQQQGISVTIHHEYHYLFNGMALSARAQDLPRLAALPGVKRIFPDRRVHAMLEQSVPLIGAPQVWNMVDGNGQPVTGQGITVAVIDTGVDYTHPDLGGCLGAGCKVIGGYDFVNRDADPMDDNGHGTHCAGIIAASGTITGVAPGARLLAYKVLNDKGWGNNSDIIAALERATDPDGNPNTDDAADVISMSLGGEGDPDDPTSQAVDAAVAAGSVVVVAAGNAGPSYRTISSPAVARRALAVGASDKADAIAEFSSRGPVPGEWAIKPDVLAPGVAIRSTVPLTGALGNPDRYRELSGTSMATPHVAGAAALLRQLHPTWTPEQIKANLMNTARDLGLDPYVQGAGRIRVDAAATVPALVVPGSLSLGLDDLTLPVWRVTRPLTVTNVSTAAQSCTFSISSILPAGITVTLVPTQVVFAPGQGHSLTFTVEVDNGSVPMPDAMPYAYSGAVAAQCGTASLSVPFAFIKAPQLILHLDATPTNGFLSYVVVHDATKDWTADYHRFPIAAITRTTYTVLAPAGTYNVIVGFDDENQRNNRLVVREGVSITATTHVTVTSADASHAVTIVPRDHRGQIISTEPWSTLSAAVWELHHGPSGFDLVQVAGGFPVDWHFSDVSSNYTWTWQAVASAGSGSGDLHALSGKLRGITGDATLENDPATYLHQRVQVRAGPITQTLSLKGWVCYHFRYPAIDCNSATLQELDSSNAGDIYLMPLPDENFRASTYLEVPFYETLHVRAFADGHLEGVAWGVQPHLSWRGENLIIGLAPPHWAARIMASPMDVRVQSLRDEGGRVYGWFYRGQFEDSRTDTGLGYELTDPAGHTISGTFSTFSSEPEEGETIPITLTGPYTLTVPYTHYWIGKTRGRAVMTATFDNSMGPVSPPYISALHVQSNGEWVDTVCAGGQNYVTLEVADDVGLKSVELFYRTDRVWQQLPLVNAGASYTATIPVLPEGLVSLRVVARDAAGNSLTYEMNPAFAYRQCKLFLPLVLKSHS